MKKRKWLIGLGVVALVAVFIVVNVAKSQSAAKQGTAVRVETLQKRDLAQAVFSPASLEIADETEVRAELTGIISLHVKEGQEVKQGDLIASIDTSDLELQIRQAEKAIQDAAGMITTAQNSIVSAQNAIDRLDETNPDRAVNISEQLQSASWAIQQARNHLATTQLPDTKAKLSDIHVAINNLSAQSTPEAATGVIEDLQSLVAYLRMMPPDQMTSNITGAINEASNANKALEAVRAELRAQAQLDKNKPTDLQNAQLNLANAQTNLINANNAYDLAVANAADLKEKLGKAKISAEKGGTVVLVHAKDGQLVQQSTVIATIAEPNKLVANVKIDELEIGKVALGMAAEIATPAYPGEKFTGTVTKIDVMGTKAPQSNTTTYGVEVTLTDTQGKLRAGMNVDAEIIAAKQADVLSVLPEAVVTENGESYVWLYNNGEAKRVSITTGLKADTGIEIKSGVSEGDVIITGPLSVINGLTEGQRVHKQ